MSDPRRRVVVTGAGVISPIGDSPEAFHQALVEGRSGLSPIRLFELDGVCARRGGEIRDFSARNYLGKGNFRPLDRAAQLATTATELALQESGLSAEEREEKELGLVLGTMFGSVHTISEFDRRALLAGPQYVKPLDFANSVINAAAGQTAIWHSLKGVNSTVAGGPSAGLQAIGYAADLIRIGRADALLAGGVDELCFESFFGYSRTGLLAPGNGAATPENEDGAAEKAVPFALGRNGFLLGEGSALLLLEEAEAARRRGAEILAEVRGHGSSFDVSRGHDPARAKKAVARAITNALDDAGKEPADVDAASLAANGSVRGDRYEALGFAEAFGERAAGLPVTAVKAALGEALGASGAFQTLALLESMRRGVLPGIPGLEERDPELPLEAALPESRELEIRCGLIHALGLDGNSCALVITAEED